MKKKRVGTDYKERRLRNLRIFSGVMLPVGLYISFCLGGLYNMEVSLETIKNQILWCLMHPLRCYSEQTWSILFVGGIIWLVASVSAYTKLNNNLMHGREYGDAKWGSVKAFNAKYAAEGVKDSIHPANKVLSENVRFRYDSDTLRNNNIFVVGVSDGTLWEVHTAL